MLTQINIKETTCVKIIREWKLVDNNKKFVRYRILQSLIMVSQFFLSYYNCNFYFVVDKKEPTDDGI